MKIAIIADDLTGASDSGVQLTRFGLKTAVLFGREHEALSEKDAVVFDTDSRSLPQAEAYQRVRSISELLHKGNWDVIFKKIDSTMRGNVGAEINAVGDVFQTDFAIIAPSFPLMGKKIIDGYHYLNGQLLHETEVSHDPKTPVNESFIPRLLEQQTKKKIGHITLQELSYGSSYVYEKLAQFKRQNVRYVLMDAAEEEHLNSMVRMITQSSYSAVWVGSAGLANVLPLAYGLQRNEQPLSIPPSDSPVLLVAGSVSRVARRQLQLVLEDPKVKGIKMDSPLFVSGGQAREAERSRMIREAVEIIESGTGLVLYSSGEPRDIDLAVQEGKRQGMDPTEVSNFIARSLGDIALQLVQNHGICRIILTGGDTAKALLSQLGAAEVELLDEVEPGVPIGQIKQLPGSYVITKAGSFGSETALLRSMIRLQARESITR